MISKKTFSRLHELTYQQWMPEEDLWQHFDLRMTHTLTSGHEMNRSIQSWMHKCSATQALLLDKVYCCKRSHITKIFYTRSLVRNMFLKKNLTYNPSSSMRSLITARVFFAFLSSSTERNTKKELSLFNFSSKCK